jgi:hypothetical protein
MKLGHLSAIDRRIAQLTSWLKIHAPECVEEQVHLDDGSRERAYWHYGYLVALRDIRGLILGRRSSLNRPNPYFLGEPDFDGIASKMVFGWRQLNPSKVPLKDIVQEALTQMYRLGQQATRSAPLPEDVAEQIKTCLAHAHNTEMIWRGKPGWSEDVNMAIEWRKAADMIERLARERDVAHARLVENEICPECGREDCSVAGDTCANCGADIRPYHAARQAKPKEDTHESGLPR